MNVSMLRFLSLFLSIVNLISAYEYRAPVDTELSINGEPPRDVLRRTMPRFSVTSNARIPVTENVETIGLSFHDSIWALPTLRVKRRNEYLDQITVTFRYAGNSLTGVSHSVSYSNDIPKDEEHVVRVKYTWESDEPASPHAGQAMMLMLVFFVVIYEMASSAFDDGPSSSSSSVDLDVGKVQ